MKKFQLYHNETYLGDLIFDAGTYTFSLSPDISLKEWNQKYGIIPLSSEEELHQNTLFEQLNIRLPIKLRNTWDDEKLNYIQSHLLKVISDSYELRS